MARIKECLVWFWFLPLPFLFKSYSIFLTGLEMPVREMQVASYLWRGCTARMLFTAPICIISCLLLNLLFYSPSFLTPSSSPHNSLAWIFFLPRASVTPIVLIKGLQGSDQSHLPSIQRGKNHCRFCLLLTSAKTFNVIVQGKPQRQIQKWAY